MSPTLRELEANWVMRHKEIENRPMMKREGEELKMSEEKNVSMKSRPQGLQVTELYNIITYLIITIS